MKKPLVFSVIILLIVLSPLKSAKAQHVIVTRSTVMIPPAAGQTTNYNSGYWKWSPRHQKYIWVIKPKARFRIHRGYRVRI